jgi:hypothetical protein
MMSHTELVTGLSMSISLILLLVEWRLFTGYREDSFRDQLFTLRDEMFLYALDEGILETPAHEKLRLLINYLIRYAHRVSFGRMVLLDLSQHLFGIKPSPPRLYNELVKAVDELPADQARRLRGFHDSATTLMWKHMVAGSPTLWLGYVAFQAEVLIFKSKRAFIDRVVKALTRRLDLLEADALRTT